MSRTGELSEYNNYFIQQQRDSRVVRRGENKVSMWDGKLEDTIASSRRNERGDDGNYKQREQRGLY